VQTRPSRDEHEATQEALNKDIAVLIAQRDKLTERLEVVKRSGDEINAKVNDARARFDALRGEHSRLKKIRQELLDERDAARSAVEKLVRVVVRRRPLTNPTATAPASHTYADQRRASSARPGEVWVSGGDRRPPRVVGAATIHRDHELEGGARYRPVCYCCGRL